MSLTNQAERTRVVPAVPTHAFAAPSAPASAGSRWLVFLMAALVVTLCGVRFVGLDHLLVWHDEVFTLIRVFGYPHLEVQHAIFSAQPHDPAFLLQFQGPDPGHGWADTLAAFEEHPEHAPLYYVLARLATGLPVEPLTAVRGVSAVFGAALIPAVFWLMRELFGKGPIPWVAAALVASSPMQLLYAQEARQYALWTLLVIAASAALQRALRGGEPSQWWLYALMLSLGLYAHLLFALMIPVHALYGWLARRNDPGFASRALRWTGAVGIAGIAFTPWLVVVLTHAAKVGSHTDWMTRPIGPERIATAWAENLVRLFSDLAPGPIGWWALLLLPIGWALVRYIRRAPRPGAWLPMLIAATYIGVMLGLDLVVGGSRSEHVRYTLPGVLALQLMVAWVVGSALGADRPAVRGLGTTALAALLGLGVLSMLAIGRADTWWNKNFSAGNGMVAEILNEGDRPLVVASDIGIGPGELISLAYRLNGRVRIWGERGDRAPVLPADFGEMIALTPSPALRTVIEMDRDLVSAAGTWQWFRAEPRPAPPLGGAR